MLPPTRGRSLTRRGGRADWLVALLLALVVCGVAVWLLGRGDENRERDPPSVADASVESVTPRVLESRAENSGASADGESSERTRRTDDEASEPRIVRALWRLVGTVTGRTSEDRTPEAREAASEHPGDDDDDEKQTTGIAGVCVRWIPSTLEACAPFLHDRLALGEPGVGERFPDGPLREAFERGRVTQTDASGNYTLDLEPPDGVPGFVIVSRVGFAMEARSFRDAELATQDSIGSTTDEPSTNTSERLVEARLDFSLFAASSISGRVTERGSGEPASGVAIQAGRVDPGSAELLSIVAADAASAVTGADGDYELQGLTPGEYRVVHRGGYSEFPGISSRQGTRVLIEPGVDVAGIDFEVSRGGTIEGRVLDPHEEPVEGAECFIESFAARGEALRGDVEKLVLSGARSAVTDADGRFLFQALDLGEQYAVLAKREGFAFARSAVVEPSEAEPVRHVELRLSEGWSIAGRVLHVDGTPAPRVPVVDRPDYSKALLETASPGEVETLTDEDGAFVLEDLPPGEYELTAGDIRAHDFFLKKPTTRRVVLDGTGDVTDVVIVLGEAAATPGSGILGVVVDDLGRPVEGASVRYSSVLDWTGLSGGAVTTSVDGRFEISGSRDSALRLAVSRTGHADTVLDGVLAPRADLVLTLARVARISGRVLLSDGAPASSGGSVRARPVNEDVSTRALQQIFGGETISDAEGKILAGGAFSIESRPGEVEVVATVAGHAPGVSPRIAVVAGGEYEGVEILVRVGAIAHGRVLQPDGRPAKGAAVLLRRIRDDGKGSFLADLVPELFGSAAGNATTDANGEFELPHLSPARYAVLATHKEFAPSLPREIELGSDEVRRLRDLELRIGSSIVGSVEMDGRPRMGMMVQLTNAGVMKRAFSRPDGSFEFLGLLPGDYMLTAVDMLAIMKQRYVLRNLVVTVAEESRSQVDIVFGSGKRILGEIHGLVPGVMRAITVRVPGGPEPEKTDLTDLRAMVEAAKFHAGFTLVTQDGPYEVPDIAPGDYILEVIEWPMRLAPDGQLEKVSAIPQLRRNVSIADEDVKLDLRVR